MSRFTIFVVAAAMIAVAAFLIVAPRPAAQVDVCSELRQIEAATDQVAKFNHRLRLQRPELRNDRNSCGVTLELISVYSQITDAQRKLGCQ
jgi:hypothetical protein